ncbi:TonB-dependent siderophore receptor [Niveibacterium terrae]|uniref:TonB-dependent siderophore receptor n=1 Tax=Niveibacterium terrae TaxID=3373598 RepID=UPI003A925A94
MPQSLPEGLRLRPCVCAICALFALPVSANESTDSHDVATITVTAQSEANRSYTARSSSTATGLDLSLRETPQAVSVITRSLMDDFALTNINSALSMSSAVIVEKVETDRTYYTARGFDVTNFQTDGLGMPFANGNVVGDIDTAIYERVDAVYGANGLISGTGYPSATVNLIRKRPTAKTNASLGASLGSWNTRRLDADVSGSLLDKPSLRARLVSAYESGDSYLDRHSHEKSVFYGIVEADLDAATTLALGTSYQSNRSKGPSWGGIPLLYSDGSATDYPTSTSTATDWAYWNSQTQSSFAELSHQLAAGWQLRAVLTHNEYSSQGKLFYAYGSPDKDTGLGLYAYPSRYDMANSQNIGDLQLTGHFALFGRTHELSAGLNWSRSALSDLSRYGQGIGTALPSLNGWNGAYAEPSFDASTAGSSFIYHQRSAYVAGRLRATDSLQLIAGARATKAETWGQSYGVDHASSGSRLTPYLGLVQDLNAELSVYASYAGIFTPQYQLDASGSALDPVKGRNLELGLKGEFLDKRLNSSLALFQSQQKNLAESAGLNPNGDTYYRGIDARSHGVQFDVSGQLSSRLQANFGYTWLAIHGDDGADVRTYTPRRLLRLSGNYRVPLIDALKLGASLSRQSETTAQASAGTVRQPAYTLLNLMAHYDLSRQLSLSAQLENVTNKKYLASMYWASTGQGYYGASRNGSVAMNWKF